MFFSKSKGLNNCPECKREICIRQDCGSDCPLCHGTFRGEHIDGWKPKKDDEWPPDAPNSVAGHPHFGDGKPLMNSDAPFLPDELTEERMRNLIRMLGEDKLTSKDLKTESEALRRLDELDKLAILLSPGQINTLIEFTTAIQTTPHFILVAYGKGNKMQSVIDANMIDLETAIGNLFLHAFSKDGTEDIKDPVERAIKMDAFMDHIRETIMNTLN